MKHELTPEVVKQIVDFAKKYEPKGDLVGIPLEVISKMLQRQYEQNGKWDVKVFEKRKYACIDEGGFSWYSTIECSSFWDKVIDPEPNLSTFFALYPERFESEPQYRDSLGYPLEIGEEIYRSDTDIKDSTLNVNSSDFKGMEGERFKGNKYVWKYAVSVKAYQNNPDEVMERIKQLEQKNQPEPVKQEEKPTKPEYVTPCGTFTEGEEVETQSGKRIFYRYDERLKDPYSCISDNDEENYINGNKFIVCDWHKISKIIPLPTIEEVANKAGITVEQLREVVKEGK